MPNSLPAPNLWGSTGVWHFLKVFGKTKNGFGIFEIKDTTESNTSASYLDLLLSIESDGQLRTSLYDKRDDFNFHYLVSVTAGGPRSPRGHM